ncbi:hypothetical protein D3C72_1489480 [compost metagenome]
MGLRGNITRLDPEGDRPDHDVKQADEQHRNEVSAQVRRSERLGFDNDRLPLIPSQVFVGHRSPHGNSFHQCLEVGRRLQCGTISAQEAIVSDQALLGTVPAGIVLS